MPEPTRPQRRWFSLSLRSLMILILIVGGLMGWLSWKIRRATIQRNAVAAITAAGGFVQYDYQIKAYNTLPERISNPTHWAPAWLRRPFGDEYFQEVQTVSFLKPAAVTPIQARESESAIDAVLSLSMTESLGTYGFPIDDAHLARVLAMPRLKEVGLFDVDITDAGLKCLEVSPAIEMLTIRAKPGAISTTWLELIAHQSRIKELTLVRVDLSDPKSLAPLAKLTKLEYLWLSKSPGDDACLAPLQDLLALKSIWLQETRLSDEGVRSLAELNQLEFLSMDGSKLTDSGLDTLAGLPRLKELRLNPAPNVTDAGLASLKRLKSLTTLVLARSNMTDFGLGHLKGMALENLAISGEGITDAGLAKLQEMTSLKSLIIVGTKVTAKGRAAFREARPGVTIEGGPNEPDPE